MQKREDKKASLVGNAFKISEQYDQNVQEFPNDPKKMFGRKLRQTDGNSVQTIVTDISLIEIVQLQDVKLKF